MMLARSFGEVSRFEAAANRSLAELVQVSTQSCP